MIIKNIIGAVALYFRIYKIITNNLLINNDKIIIKDG